MTDQERFKQEIYEMKQRYKSMNEEEKQQFDKLKRKNKLAPLIDRIHEIIGKQGFQVFRYVVE